MHLHLSNVLQVLPPKPDRVEANDIDAVDRLHARGMCVCQIAFMPMPLGRSALVDVLRCAHRHVDHVDRLLWCLRPEKKNITKFFSQKIRRLAMFSLSKCCHPSFRVCSLFPPPLGVGAVLQSFSERVLLFLSFSVLVLLLSSSFGVVVFVPFLLRGGVFHYHGET